MEGKKKRLGKIRWKSTLRTIGLKNKHAFHPLAVAYSQVTEISLRLKICSLRCYDPSSHSSPRNQVAGSCNGQMQVGEKPSGCRSCSGSRVPSVTSEAHHLPRPQLLQPQERGQAYTWTPNLVWMDTWHNEKVRLENLILQNKKSWKNAKHTCTPHEQHGETEPRPFSFETERVIELVFLKPPSNLIDVKTDSHCPVKNEKDKKKKKLILIIQRIRDQRSVHNLLMSEVFKDWWHSIFLFFSNSVQKFTLIA